MAKKKNIPKLLTDEEIAEMDRKSELDNAKTIIGNIGEAPNDRKIFVVGEQVYSQHGGFISAIILSIIENGIYEIEITYMTNIPYSDKTIQTTKIVIACWGEIQKLSNKQCDLVLGEKLHLQFFQTTLHSIIRSYIMYFGTNVNPSYQRDLVWDNDNEVKLIDSIFNFIDIGKFVFIKNNTETRIDKYYEVLDGKQRLNTLIRFYTDQFQYKGYYYSELPILFKHTFLSFSVSVADIEDINEKQRLKYFLSLNKGGKPMDEKHLNKINDMYINLW